MVAVAPRGEEELLGATVNVIVLLPVPLVDEAVTQFGRFRTVHEQPLPAVIERLTFPPADAADTADGERAAVDEQVDEAGWERFTDLPAAVKVALRELPPFFAIVSVTMAMPDPVDGDAVIHDGRPVTDHPHPLPAVTVRLAVPPPPGIDRLVGDTVDEHEVDAAACETLTDLPATVIVWLRDAVVALAAIVSVTVTLPDPLAGDAAIQDARFATVHAQPLPAVTVTGAVPPPDAIDTFVGDTPYVHDVEAAACDTFTDLPATMIVLLRDDVVPLAATASVTVALPEPLAGDAVIQDARFVTVHAQPLPAPTLTLTLPPEAPTDSVIGDTL
jgi:hypothetical protein